MDFKRDLKQKIHNINENLEAYLKEVYPPILNESMCYSLMAGGKRLRPLLLLGAYEAETGSASDITLPFACALEMIHTYSLIHDDLPAMDDDDFRRGKPTNHKVYGEALAILAGDSLLNKAYEIMTGYCAENIEARFIQAMKIIADAAGAAGMVGGQAADTHPEKCGLLSNEESAERLLEYIHEHKTGALLTASVVAGAVLGKASPQRLKQYAEVGKKLGLSFQIKDDILNVTGNSAILGKPVKSDDKNKKLTYVSFYGLKKAEKDFETFSQEAMTILQELCPQGGFLTELVKTMAERVK